MRFFPSIPAFVLIVSMAVPGFCEPPAYRLDDIIVTASRFPSALKEAPANVSIITSDEIEKSGAQTIADALQREPGIFTQNLLGNPKLSNIDIRGYGEAAPQNVLVLVNGRRVNGIDLTGADLAQIPMDAIERVEVYRGPGTVLYGDNAAAGVVNIILKSGQGPPKVVVSATVGSYNFFKPELVLSGKEEKLSYLAALSEVNTQGYRHNNQFYAKDALGNFRFEAFRNLAFNLSAGHHRDSYGQPGALFWSDLRKGIVDPKDSTRSYIDGRATTEDNFIDLDPEMRLGESVLLSLGASYRNRHISSSFDYGFGSSYLTRGQIETYSFTPKLVMDGLLWKTVNNVLILGFDWYKYPTTADSTSSFGGSSKNDVEKRDFAYYVSDKLYPLPGLLLEAGYRHQRSVYDIRHYELTSGVAEPSTSSRYDRDAFRLSANYSVLEKADIFASYSKGFRFPATDEFITWGYYDSWTKTYFPTQINTALKPQTTREFDAGLRWNPWRRFSGSITFFHADNKDEIYYNPLTFMNQNYDRTKRRGVETSLFCNLAANLVLNVAYSYTEAFFDGGPFDGNRIPLVPRNKASAKISYAVSGWDFSFASVYVGDRYAISDQENGREKLPGYTTFDTSIGYGFKALSALFTVKNITDKRYAGYGAFSPFKNDIGLYPSPGRQFFLTVRYVIGG